MDAMVKPWHDGKRLPVRVAVVVFAANPDEFIFKSK